MDKYMKYIYSRTDAYAFFFGWVESLASETSHRSRKLICDGDYQKMYEKLRAEIRQAAVELDKKLSDKGV